MKNALSLSKDALKELMQNPISINEFNRVRLQVISELTASDGSVRLSRIKQATYDKVAFLCEKTNVVLKITEIKEEGKSRLVPLAQIVAVYRESGVYYASDVLLLRGTQCPFATDAFDTWKAEIDQLRKFWWVIEEKIITHLIPVLFPENVSV